jgi:hypothetical protein
MKTMLPVKKAMLQAQSRFIGTWRDCHGHSGNVGAEF